MAYTFADWRAGVRPPDGWDCADAVDDGWTKSDLDTYMRTTARLWVPPAERAIEARHMELSGKIKRQTVAPAYDRPAEDRAGVRSGPVGGCHASPSRRSPPPVQHSRAAGDAALGAPLVLDRRDPLQSARKLLADRYTENGVRTLHHHRGTFHEWTGVHYRQADPGAVDAIIWTFLEHAICLTETDPEPFRPTRARVGDVRAALAAASNLSAHVEPPAWLTENDMPPAIELLPVQNGLLHLSSGDLYPPTPEYFGLNAAGVAFDPDALEPKEWLRFLEQIWGEDRQSIETLQDIAGYLLAPDTSQQKIMLIVGPKRSGKGTIARVLTGLLGRDSVAAPTLASLATNFGLAPLIGRSVASIGDARLSARADQAAIAERLLSISGEDSITIDRKFLSAWTGRLPIRFLIMTNELPRLSDASGALASRFVVLTMERSFFGNEDRALGNRLMGELPGILNWARVGYLRLQKRGYFLQPDSAREAVDELEALGSPVASFVKDRCTVASGLQCPAERLFGEWKLWCEASGRREPGTIYTFGRDLRAVVTGLRVVRPRIEGHQTRFYEGIGIAGATEQDRSRPYNDW
ncbi:phage/plasmid primase, P4 family [Xanthobacter autotrophicus DSM 431]|uniref:DNA primase family protein n=1 Tax=Xanthobacter nonsaccharivorans TaxID=3119912 RepID=UPI00372751C8